MSHVSKDKPSAFARLVSISSLTKLADLLVSPKTTLPWILSAGGAPGWMISLLVPIKESGSLLPQWLLKTSVVNHFSNHTGFWRIGAIVQGIGILVMVFAMIQFNRSLLAVAVLTLLLMISFGRAICSLSMKNIQAQSIEKGRRGRLIGLASSISGGLTMTFAVIYLMTGNQLSQTTSYWLLIAGGILFLLATVLSLPLHVSRHEERKRQAGKSGLLTMLTDEKDLRQLIISRILLMHSALIVPFIVAASSQSQQGSHLSYFVGLSALASMLSSYFWGSIADKSALLSLKLAATMCVIASFCVGFGLADTVPYLDLILFFILTLGHAGIRTGRKTYLLDITQTDNRTAYVAAANTCVGIALLTLGAGYAALSSLMGEGLIMLMSAMLLLGLIHSLFLPAEK